MCFLEEPNIPKSKVRLCAISSGYPTIMATLERLGVEVIEIEPHKMLPKPIDSHADMQLHDLGQGRVVIAKGAEKLAKILEKCGFVIEEQEIGEVYPSDISLNCFMLSNNLFCKEGNTSKILLNYYQSIGARAVRVKQGYAKCSTCIINESSIITSDVSIAKAARACDIDVLQIQSGSISLPGYSTGFIGGCCGLIDKNILAFCGKISKHPDYAAIRSFCCLRRVQIIELDNCVLTDVGGILPLTIYDN